MCLVFFAIYLVLQVKIANESESHVTIPSLLLRMHLVSKTTAYYITIAVNAILCKNL